MHPERLDWSVEIGRLRVLTLDGVRVMAGGGDEVVTLFFSLAVEGAAHGARAAVEDVGVDLRGLDVFVAE